METNVLCFPNWKPTGTSIERLEELLIYARLHPEDVKHIHIVYEKEDGQLAYTFGDAPTLGKSVGMLEVAKLQIMGAHTHED